MKAYLSEQGDGHQAKHLLASSRHRPFIGISVSNRLLPLETTVKVLSWVQHSPAPILPILIADEIAVINYKAFKHYSGGSCLKKVQRDAELQISRWQAAAEQLPPELSQRIRFVRWPEIVTPLYQQQVEVVRSEFARGGLLQETILALVENFIRYLGKTVTPQRCMDLAEYVIQELPSLLFGIEVDGIYHQMLIYPTHYPTEMQRLVVAIRRSPFFADFLAALHSPSLEYNKIVQLILTGQRFGKPPIIPQPINHELAAHESLVAS